MMIGIDLMAHLSNAYENKLSPIRYKGSSIPRKFTHPGIYSFLAVISQEEVSNCVDSTNIIQTNQVTVSKDDLGHNHDSNQMRTTTRVMLFSTATGFNLARKGEEVSLQGLNHIPYHRGGEKNLKNRRINHLSTLSPKISHYIIGGLKCLFVNF